MNQKADIGAMKFINQLLLLTGMIAAFSPLCFSANETKTKDEGVTSHGVVFNIAKDRKVEKVGGLYEPEGLDKYVDRKVSELSERMARFEAQLDQTNSKLDEISKKLSAMTSAASPATKDNT